MSRLFQGDEVVDGGSASLRPAGLLPGSVGDVCVCVGGSLSSSLVVKDTLSRLLG